MTEKAPDTSIIIPSRNGEDELRDLLPRLNNQKYNGDVQIVVVDSSSTDDTVEVSKAHGADVYTIEKADFHHGRTRNFGAKKADNDVLVFTTDDTFPANDNWLRSLTSPLSNEAIGAVYGRQLAYPDAKPPDEFFYTYFYPDESTELNASDVENPASFYLNNIYISDVSAAVRADVWEDVQFGEDVVWSEDKEFAHRLLESGYRIRYEADAQVYHSHDYSLRSLYRRRFQDGQGYAMLTSSGEGDFVNNGTRYVFEELRFLLRQRALYWIPFVLLYDLVHFVAFQLGNIRYRLYHRNQT